MKLAPTVRAAALLTAVALLPATTAVFAQVEGRSSPEFAKLFATYQRIKSSYVEPVDGEVKVVSPFKGSPADKAGIKAGDYITHIDGKLIYGLELDDAVKQMRGPAGSSIQLSIFRPGRDEPFDVTVTRGVIELEPVTSELKEGGIGYISVNEFSRDVGADVNSAIASLRRDSGGRLAGLVLDLRKNPGGSLDEAVALSDLFLTQGQIVSQRGRNPRDSVYYEAESVYRGDVANG